MMSKKDYELVAKASVAANLISTNPRFDHHRFLEACGYYLNT